MNWIFTNTDRSGSGLLGRPGGTGFLLAFLLSFLVVAQVSGQDGTTMVSGQVTGPDGFGLPGVTVRVEGENRGTVTNLEGQYSIEAGEEDVLLFSYVGFEDQRIVVGNRSTIDVVLTEDVQSLDEVVVVGYGAQKRSDITGSVVDVGQETISEVPAASDVSQALKGRIAGVEIQTTSSRPGAGTQIRIRGNRSLGGDESGVNDPLIVLDGIPYSGNLNDINPSIIESLSVLKDASATAIYGSRGANGVILITTRRGKEGAPLVSYNGYYGITSEIDQYDLFNAEEYADLVQASNFQQEGGFFTPAEKQNILMNRGTDWQDLMYKNGYITNHEVSVTGGSETTQYAFSGGYFDQTTVLPGQSFQRYTLRSAIDQQLGERVKIGLTTMNTLSLRNGESVSPMFQMLTLSPLYNAYTEDGEINLYPAVGSIEENIINPLTLYRENSWNEERRRLRTFNTLYGELDILEGLKYRLNIGLDYWQDEYGQFSSAFTPMQGGRSALENAGSIRNTDTWSYTIENLLTYNRAFGDHNLNLTGLFSVQEQESNRSGLNAQAIYADYLQFYNFGLAGDITIPNNPGDQPFNYERWGLVSTMGRAIYNYADRYILTATLRADGSSRLAEGNKWFVYPAGALAWNIMNESFMEDVDAFSNLRMRFGVGRTSNQAIAPYSSLGGLARRAYNFGNTGTFGFLVSSLPNPNLTWEFTTSYNLGIDFGFLTNRITGSLDLYQTFTDNVLQARNLPVTAGVPGSIRQNIGETEGRGIELMANAIVLDQADRDDFGLSLSMNFTSHRERITQLSGTITEDVGNAWFVGQPVNVVYDYQKIGIWQLDEADEADAFGGYRPGDIKVADLNDNGVRDEGDRTVLGQLDPKWSAGLTPRLTYKGFDLSVVTFARYGGMLVSTLYQARQEYPINTLEGRRNGPQVDYWTPDNPTNEYPIPGDQQPEFGSTLGYFDGSFMKIRSINLGYTLTDELMEQVGISTARVYLTADNPFKAFFSEYVQEGGIDPEPTGRGETATPGLGRRLIVTPDTPITRTILFGVNITF